MEKILTVPECVKQNGVVYCTGNQLVSVSNISANGNVNTIAHLRESSMSLIEYVGEPLISLSLCGKALPQGTHEYIHSFIPQFYCETDDACVTRRIFAQDGIRGFVISVDIKAKHDFKDKLSLAFNLRECSRTVFKPLPLTASSRFGVDAWTDTAYVELSSGGGITALAIGAKNCTKAASDKALCLTRELALLKGATESILFYISLGCELDGARLANVDMARRGAALYEGAVQQYSNRRICLPNKIMENAVNLNFEFCRAFSVGRTLDTNRLALLTSKSGRYYVSGAYWARDCMLWAFPALLRTDVPLAREALLAACTTYLQEGANHALYINGTSLYPGFELDQLVAPIIALQRYVERTNDSDVLLRSEIQYAMHFTISTLQQWRCDKTGLYKTELSPSDDPCEYQFLTYNNFLVLAALRFLDRQVGGLAQQIKQLEAGIYEHCVVKSNNADVFCWACDGKGGVQLYDNPPGSLMLIPYYGGCEVSNQIWQNTKQLYFSTQNPYFTKNGALLGQGCEHAKQPWPMSLCNVLLSCGASDEIYAALCEMSMDNKIACETVWPETGEVCTGAAFATFAGFYANAIVESYDSKN